VGGTEQEKTTGGFWKRGRVLWASEEMVGRRRRINGVRLVDQEEGRLLR
jgi:hypothetical protein